MGARSRCAACKYLRKRCLSYCIFSPYFPSNDPRRFESVHKIYGASNVARMLQRIPEKQREQAVDSLYFEAQCRIEDPVYGCVKIIYQLQQEINTAQSQLTKIQAQIALIANPYGLAQDPEIDPVQLSDLVDSFFSERHYDEYDPYERPGFPNPWYWAKVELLDS
ncbi:hypothetical protein Cgig2_029974 [Carnegiea gigantea]|uniref:LOB domain-containing protein n=1 Tax=Carnegiea gigantea TaxID=171969 RepID=A0A9Q1K720_9CARY|nr:hypothetical protein Cgig2_029974 [Carnegiea gigantea]